MQEKINDSNNELNYNQVNRLIRNSIKKITIHIDKNQLEILVKSVNCYMEHLKTVDSIRHIEAGYKCPPYEEGPYSKCREIFEDSRELHVLWDKYLNLKSKGILAKDEDEMES